MSSINEDILRYQRKISKYSTDAKVLLHCLGKLSRLPIGVEHLQETGIGRTINGMRKTEGPVGEEARSLVNKWKEMVAAEDKSDSENDQEEAKDVDSDKGDESLIQATESKSKESPKEDKHKASSSKSKSGSSRTKSPERSKSSKSGDKHKEGKNSGSSKSSSKSSKKRHREDSTSQASSENNETGEGRSFAEALGSIDISPKKKKSKDKEKNREEKKHKASSSVSLPPSLPTPLPAPPQLKSPPVDVRPLDFEISPHYKPLPSKFVTDLSQPQPKPRLLSEEEALSVAMSHRGSRTKVFSGKRSTGLAYLPSLFDICIQVLQQNIDALEFTGGVPFDLLRPVLERASSTQLYSLENFNPYLLEDTDQLWKLLCQKEYRKAVREELETWRDLYLRCHEEREARLKILTSKNKSAMATATPVRTTKLAYVESVAKPLRGSKKNGSLAVLESMTKSKAGVRPFEASTNHGGASGGTTLAEVVKANPPPSRSSTHSSASKKPKMAPLMQKTMKLIKNRYRR